jgi:drug/metabolite transporter (DMT)-like permease
MPILYAMLLFATWSLIFPISKLTLQNAPPVFLTSIRMLLAGVVLLTLLLFKDRSLLKIGKKQIVPLLALSVCSIYLTNIFEFWSMQHLSSVKVCFIYGLSPFLAVILSYFHFKETITKQKVLGMAIGFGGFIPVLFLQTGSENLFSIFNGFSLPDLAMIGAAFFSIYGWILLRIVVKDQTLSPLYANGYSMLFGGILSLIHSFLVDQWDPLPIADGKVISTLSLVVLMTVVSNIICYNWYGYMLRSFTATFLSFCGLFSPIFVSFTSWVILGEELSWTIFLSTAVVLSGLFLIYQAELKQGYLSSKKLIPARTF